MAKAEARKEQKTTNLQETRLQKILAYLAGSEPEVNGHWLTFPMDQEKAKAFVRKLAFDEGAIRVATFNDFVYKHEASKYAVSGCVRIVGRRKVPNPNPTLIGIRNGIEGVYEDETIEVPCEDIQFNNIARKFIDDVFFCYSEDGHPTLTINTKKIHEQYVWRFFNDKKKSVLFSAMAKANIPPAARQVSERTLSIAFRQVAEIGRLTLDNTAVIDKTEESIELLTSHKAAIYASAGMLVQLIHNVVDRDLLTAKEMSQHATEGVDAAYLALKETNELEHGEHFVVLDEYWFRDSSPEVG